jgi:hypothetical protein
MQLVSVDDHVIEPPHVWSDRLPKSTWIRPTKVISLFDATA